MESDQKEVYFHKYCKTCKHEKLAEADEPCCECLDAPTNIHSHKPTNWEEKS